MINLFKRKKAFSLIEMMISVTIFSVVVLLIVQVFHMVIKSEKRVSNSFTVQEDLKFFTEFIFRDMRMARQSWGRSQVYNNYKYHSSLEFNEDSGIEYIDALDRKTQIYPVLDGDSGVVRVWARKYVPTGNGSSLYFMWHALTPANVDISELKFIIDEPMSGGEHNKQPMVTVFVKGRTLASQENTELSLQTSVISRFYDE
jgi:prepilin-type N-terminal cleavage/methylation domain-containing protein